MDTIYKITSPSKKVYIGRTNNLNRRILEHKSTARSGGWSLHKAINKYGWDNMVVEEIAKVVPEESQTIEEAFIILYDSVKNGYNDTYIGSGGDQWKGRRNTKEYKEYIKKMTRINGGYNNGMFGKSQSVETISKMKQKAKGRFSLDWYIDRNGKQEGTRLYEERRQFLKNRNLKKDKYGRFISKTSQ